MSEGSSYDVGSAAPHGPMDRCGFPACEQQSVNDHGMCELHRRVAISRTGSWLEAS